MIYPFEARKIFKVVNPKNPSIDWISCDTRKEALVIAAKRGWIIVTSVDRQLKGCER